jgi:hypothetical protein
MTTGQEFYLAMVIVAFCLFGIVLAIVSWTERRSATMPQVAGATPAAEVAVPRTRPQAVARPSAVRATA